MPINLFASHQVGLKDREILRIPAEKNRMVHYSLNRVLLGFRKFQGEHLLLADKAVLALTHSACNERSGRKQPLTAPQMLKVGR